jgi:hypothetical protein
MTRWAIIGTVIALAGCRSPRPVYEYERTITTTSTDKPVPQLPGAAAEPAPTTTTLPPRAPTWRRGGTL